MFQMYEEFGYLIAITSRVTLDDFLFHYIFVISMSPMMKGERTSYVCARG